MSRTQNKKIDSPPTKPLKPVGVKTRVLFVCMGNICRSPMAKGVFDSMVKAAGLTDLVLADSAGTHGFHAGEPADPRAIAAAQKRGYDLTEHVARKIELADFSEYDYILAMDWDNLALMEAGCPQPHRRKLRRLMEFAPEGSSPVVPDPYLGGPQGFEQVLDLIEHASDGLTKHLEKLIRRKSDPSV